MPLSGDGHIVKIFSCPRNSWPRGEKGDTAPLSEVRFVNSKQPVNLSVPCPVIQYYV
jgi:hypothetical protein